MTFECGEAKSEWTKAERAASSQPGKLIKRSESDIRKYAKSPASKDMSARLRALGPDPTAEDLKDVPALSDEQLSKLYRPVKSPVTVRIDGDILQWLKSKGGRYQTHLNAALRSQMKRELR